MRILQITVAGFRGFNEERTIYFNKRLTLVSAPNSHGKTSITEALEFLLFGQTSKVAHAMSKEEYRDSYRNKHWPQNRAAYIEAICVTDDHQTTYRIELDASGDIRRFVDGKAAAEWPFGAGLEGTASPFILQHALKYLLLVAPSDRFQGFAQLLGLNDVDALQRDIVSLCTKPEATIPVEGKAALADLQALQGRFLGLPLLVKAKKALELGPTGVTSAYGALEARADKLLKGKVPAAERVAKLIRLRDEHAAKVFAGTVAIRHLDDDSRQKLDADVEALAAAVSATFIEDYSRVAAREVAERIASKARLLKVGLDLITEAPDACPLCGQGLDESLRRHIRERHDALARQHAPGATLEDASARVRRTIDDLVARSERLQEVAQSRSRDLFEATGTSEAKVGDLFGQDNQASWETARSAAQALAPLHATFLATAGALDSALLTCESAIKANEMNAVQCEALGGAVNNYLVALRALVEKGDELEPVLVAPGRVLRQAIDTLAGTTEVSLIIELLDRRPFIERALRVQEVLDGLKGLKRAVEQTVGEVMEAAINADLSGSVMDWYGKLRTKGDPDVHFSGFAMQRTKDGDFKKGKVAIGARSYGVDLASAVSSLSESKLNALGLCVSIASALHSPGPWEFLVLDDPIQSWDAEHETQFIEVIRALVDKEDKQVILLTHKGDWAQQVGMGCRALNGLRFEVTSYTKQGPQLREMPWATVDQRISEIGAIANSAHATTVQLQQAEEEVRLAVCQFAAGIAAAKLGRATSPHNMNKNDVRAILNAAGCESELIDKVYATFGTADDAHHAPKTYSANAQRVRQYLQTLGELQKINNAAVSPLAT